jgi:hypothetical protein
MDEAVRRFLNSLRRSRAHRRTPQEWAALFKSIKDLPTDALVEATHSPGIASASSPHELDELFAETQAAFGLFRGTHQSKFALVMSFIPAAAHSIPPNRLSFKDMVTWLERSFGAQAVRSALAQMRDKAGKERRVGGVRPLSRR